MKVQRGPAILAAITAVVAVVVIVLVAGGGDDAATPTSGEGDVTQSSGGDGGSGGQSGAGGGQGQGGSGQGQGGGSQPEVPTIEVEGGEPVDGVEELSFQSGEEIRFAVASDTADEIHFHGYDLYADVPAGGEGEIETKATIEGVFEVELHGSGVQIAQVTVNP